MNHLTIALLLQIAGTVVHIASGEPVPNVRVSLARIEAAPIPGVPELFANPLSSGDEITIPGDLLKWRLTIATSILGDKSLMPILTGLLSKEQDAFELILNRSGHMAIVTHTTPPQKTGINGRFAFENVPPGNYRLIFAANGYARQDYGQRFAGGPGEPMEVKPGDSKRDLVMQMTPTAAIAGRIRDVSGRPAAGVSVELSRLNYDADGKKRLTRVANTEADDRGEYRLYFLTPGRYLLSAGRPSTNVIRSGMPFDIDPATAQLLLPNRIHVVYPQTYYPGVTDRDAATPIDLLPGAERDNVDLILSPIQVPLRRVRGRVIDSTTGEPPPVFPAFSPGGDFFLGLWLRSEEDSSSHGTSVKADGTFELRNVRPGSYILNYRTRPAGTPAQPNVSLPAGALKLTVGDADLDDVVLRLVPGGSISGRVRWDGGDSGASLFGPMSLRLQSLSATVTNEINRTGQYPIKTDGTFTIPDVYPGEYRIGVAGLPEGSYLKSAQFGDADVLRWPLHFSSAGSEPRTLDIVVSAKGGRIDGKAVPGAQVVLIPDERLDRTDLFKSTFAAADGRFRLAGIAAGNYKLIAWDALEPYAFFAPDLLKQAEEMGLPLKVTEASAQTVEVMAIPSVQ